MNECAVILGMLGVGRWFEAEAVNRYPQLFRAPDLRENLMHPRMLPDIPHRLMVIHLDHPVGPERLPVPPFRICGGHSEKIEYCGSDGVEILLRHGIGGNDVAVLLEE